MDQTFSAATLTAASSVGLAARNSKSRAFTFSWPLFMISALISVPVGQSAASRSVPALPLFSGRVPPLHGLRGGDPHSEPDNHQRHGDHQHVDRQPIMDALTHSFILLRWIIGRKGAGNCEHSIGFAAVDQLGPSDA